MNVHTPTSETGALVSLGACGVSTLCTFASNVEPVVNLIAGAIAVVTGLLAGVHYVIKIWDRLKHGHRPDRR